jgi:hypothetical protein
LRLRLIDRKYLGEVDEEGGVSDVISGDGRSFVSDFGEVCFSARAEDGHTEDGVAAHDGAVLDQEVVEDSHVQSLLDDGARVGDEVLERIGNSLLLPVVASVEGDFFRVVDKIVVASSVVTFEFYESIYSRSHTLFDGSELSEGRGDESHEDSAEEVPGVDDDRTFPSLRGQTTMESLPKFQPTFWRRGRCPKWAW